MSTAVHCHPISVDEYLHGVSTIMKSPFPGVDPYLEEHWGDIHTSLMVYIRDQINEQLPNGLQARVEESVCVFMPSEQITERHVEIVDFSSGNREVTAIELLSPANKREESGRQAYRRKQFEYIAGE